MARVGKTLYMDAFKFFETIKNFDSLAIWNAARLEILPLLTMMREEECFYQFKVCSANVINNSLILQSIQSHFIYISYQMSLA